jgi:hypothetical protein
VSTSRHVYEVPAVASAQAALRREVRARLAGQLYDDSGSTPQGIAIYSLSDPRELRELRYIGQTRVPRRRLLQHLNTARLWLPDERPWWVRCAQLRPLYEWIRELYRAHRCLPLMVVGAWVSEEQARVAEQAQIRACLAQRLPLLNVETERLQRQLQLL